MLDCHKKGFTLIELLITLTILAIVLGTAAPLLVNTRNSYTTKIFIKKLNTLLNHVQNSALTLHKTYRITLDFHDYKVLLENRNSNNWVKVIHFFRKDFKIPRIFLLNEEKIDLRETYFIINVSPDGIYTPITLPLLIKNIPHDLIVDPKKESPITLSKEILPTHYDNFDPPKNFLNSPTKEPVK
ncbi:hypothetical protein AB834_06440 [PVC group bacterium (ex Bugula neritina AB1)]|nr:hypothetical protein AB834_06440 [PVC group bacterium (ex Bugula neritina AB1)]